MLLKDDPKIIKLREIIDTNQEFIILAPDESYQDPDSVGSNYALKVALENIGKTVAWIGYGGTKKNLRFCAGALDCIDIKNNLDALPKGINNYPIVIISDGSYQKMFEQAFARLAWLPEKYSISIDHHSSTPSDFVDLAIIDPSQPAAAGYVYLIAEALGLELSPEAGKAIIQGIINDTGFFQNLNTTNGILELTAGIATKYQINLGLLAEEINYARGFALENLAVAGKVLSTQATNDSGITTAYIKYLDTKDLQDDSGMIDLILSQLRYSKDTDICIVIGEVKPQEYKGSLRCRDGFDVAQIAEKLGGGGHKVAAGFKLKGYTSAEECLEHCLKTIREFYPV